MKKLHPKQEKLLNLLRENIDNPLTINEMGEFLNISSKGVVHHHLTQLERKGYLKRSASNPRDYVVLDTPENAIVHIPKFGLARCGPGGGILDGNPVARIPVPSSLLKYPAEEAFIVEAIGKSMEPRIHAGDLVIAQKNQQPSHGELIVCVYETEALIKQFIRVGEECFLYSLNNDRTSYPPRRIVNEEDFKVEGVVRNIFHRRPAWPR